MKRHIALEPFSRDHNDGLHLARALKENREAAAEMMQTAWDCDLKDHFEEEERLLGPFAGSLADQLFADHGKISDLVSRLPDSAIELGVALEEHIRWEERILFPMIERGLLPEQASDLEIQANQMEIRRWNNCAKRGELVRRRWQKNLAGAHE